jgi:hypothetical protein
MSRIQIEAWRAHVQSCERARTLALDAICRLEGTERVGKGSADDTANELSRLRHDVASLDEAIAQAMPFTDWAAYVANP